MCVGGEGALNERVEDAVVDMKEMECSGEMKQGGVRDISVKWRRKSVME